MLSAVVEDLLNTMKGLRYCVRIVAKGLCFGFLEDEEVGVGSSDVEEREKIDFLEEVVGWFLWGGTVLLYQSVS